MSQAQEKMQELERFLTRIRESKDELEALENTLLTAYTVNWGAIPSDYKLVLTEDVDDWLILTLASYYARVDYYELVKMLPEGSQLCHHLNGADTLLIEDKYPMSEQLAGVLRLRARLPVAVKTKLRKDDIIQDHFVKASTYETVVCPSKVAVTADDDIPF